MIETVLALINDLLLGCVVILYFLNDQSKKKVWKLIAGCLIKKGKTCIFVEANEGTASYAIKVLLF